MRTLTRKTKKPTTKNEKTNSPRTVAKKWLKKDFISTPYFED
jgi:hypothetical protein